MKKTKAIIISVLVTVLFISGCRNASSDDLLVQGTEVPTAAVTGEVTPATSDRIESSVEGTEEEMSAEKTEITPSEVTKATKGISRLVYEGDRFELGNSVNDIFQAGTEFSNTEYHFWAKGSGLYDVNNDEYLTDYMVYNLNYFDGVLYYTVDDNMNFSESRKSSRIEKYDLLTGEITTLYSHPKRIGEMYCINNEFFLFISKDKIYKKNIGDSSDAEEIVFSNSQMEGIPIFSLIPTKDGVILIGKKDGDYSLFADGVLFKEHVYIVYVEKNYLVLGIDGNDYKVDMETIFERLDNWLEDDETQSGDKSTSAFSIAGLIENCDLYPETTMGELFPNTPLFNQENHDDSIDESVTPTPILWEGYVIDKEFLYASL